MRRARRMVGLAVLVHVAAAGSPALAFFHTWRFTEFFSSADGDVQFIEMTTTSNSEHFSNGAQITSQSTGKTFTFNSNLPSSLTANKRLLIATPGFELLPGAVMPDFFLPSTDFFNPAGDTIRMIAGSTWDTRVFASVPTDGVMSRVYPSNATAVNTPTNFTGANGSVNVAPPPLVGDFDGDNDVDGDDLAQWILDFGATDGSDADDDGDSDGADFLAWQRKLGSPAIVAATEAVPEPATLLLIVSGGLAMPLRRRTVSKSVAVSAGTS